MAMNLDKARTILEAVDPGDLTVFEEALRFLVQYLDRENEQLTERIRDLEIHEHNREQLAKGE